MRAFLIRRSSISLAICGIAAVLMFYVVNYPAAVNTSASARQLPIYCVQRDQKLVSISFDAAWGNEDTQTLIDILDRFQVKATFFVVGDWVDKYPESVKALHDAGHEVMNHSNTHAHYPQLSAEEVVDDLNACNDKIEAVTGVRPTWSACPMATTTTTPSAPSAPSAWSPSSGTWTAWTGRRSPPRRSPSG